MFNRATEVKTEIDFRGEGGGLQEEMYHFADEPGPSVPLPVFGGVAVAG